MRTYTALLLPDRESGGFYIVVPALPGAVSQGETREEALANIREAMEGWLAVAHDAGFDALDETPDVIAGELRQLLADRAETGWDMAFGAVAVPVEARAAA